MRPNAALVDRITRALFFTCGLVAIIVFIGIIVVLVGEALGFFFNVNPIDFFFGTEWTPLLKPQQFGVLPLISGTLLVTVGAAFIAVPIGVAIAIYLAEYAPSRVRNIVKPALEVLSGIPTIVYGYFAITFVTEALGKVLPVSGFNALSASIVVGIMILPMVASLCEDAFRAVPRSLREAGLAMGATRWEVSIRIVFPAAFSGVVAAFVLAISRAIGETMAVTLAAGAKPNLTFNPFEEIQTMTAYIVQVTLGDAPAGSIEYQSVFAVGITLFALTLLMNIIANLIMRRLREEYA